MPVPHRTDRAAGIHSEAHGHHASPNPPTLTVDPPPTVEAITEAAPNLLPAPLRCVPGYTFGGSRDPNQGLHGPNQR